MGINIHKNHIVPQFYLKQWYGKDNNLFCYDLCHHSELKRTSGDIGYIKDTYSDEIEKELSKYENEISKIYANIMSKLEKAEWKQVIKNKLKILNDEEEYYLFLFLYLQKKRTITGRLKISNKEYYNLGINDSQKYAEEQNLKFLNEITNIDKNNIYKEISDCYYFIFRTEKYYEFWTSSNPVHHGRLEHLFHPRKEEISTNYSNLDTIMISLNPKLKLCITYANSDVNKILYNYNGGCQFKKNNLYVLPLNVDKKWKENDDYKQDRINKINLGLLESYELQYSINNKKEQNVDLRNAQYFLISHRQFSKNQLDILNKIGIG